jgi:hypothetical protein
MTSGRFVSAVRRTTPFLLPIIAATLFISKIMETKYQEGWFAAQGCIPQSGCVLGEFNLGEYVVIGALVCASFVFVGVGRIKLGNYLALILALLCGMAWLGATR